jgi:hypothetical protein
MSLVLDILGEIWFVLAASAPWFLIGCLGAGLLHALLPMSAVAKHLGGRGLGGILKATIAGIPLPLCSCSVIPMAASLRRRGASPGASSAFAVSTPETGVDSIALTYALLGPGLAIARPIAAFLSALAAGLGVAALGKRAERSSGTEPEGEDGESRAACCEQGETAKPASGSETCCAGGACCTAPLDEATPKSWPERTFDALHFAFLDLFDDLAVWLAAGFVIAGVMAALLPDDVLARWGGDSAWAPLVMLFAGLPLYVCATSSTPIAAALMLKGLSPGAALVFLLAGPATNAATMAWVLRDFGARALAVYLASIAVVALGLGYAVDALDVPVQIAAGLAAEGEALDIAAHLSAALLLFLILRPIALRLAGRLAALGAAMSKAS